MNQALSAHPGRSTLLLSTAATIALTGAALASGLGAPAPTGAGTGCGATDDLVVTIGGEPIAVSLADSVTASQVAAALPPTLALRDSLGQAFSTSLPGLPLPVADDLTLDPEPGGVYYALDSHAIAFYYDDLGDVPPPGWALVGTIDAAGVQALADAAAWVDAAVTVCG